MCERLRESAGWNGVTRNRVGFNRLFFALGRSRKW